LKADRLSNEWMIRTLVNMGFTLNDAKIYVFLATEGPQKRKNIAIILNLRMHQVCSSLKELQKLQMVTSLTSHSVTFSAISFEKALDLFWNKKMGNFVF
jgi:sugar-specific transcriptional regulator TrmB